MIAGSIALVAYVAVLWDFGVNPFRTALGGSDFSGFYDIQMRQFFHGRLDVPVGELGLEAFALRGKEYMYFPPGPSLLRAPFLLFTDEPRRQAHRLLDARGVGRSPRCSSPCSCGGSGCSLRGRAPLGRGEAAALGVLLFTVLSGSVRPLPGVAAVRVPRGLRVGHRDGRSGRPSASIGLVDRPTTRGAVAAGAFTLGAILSRTTAGWACAGRPDPGRRAGSSPAAATRPQPRRWVPTLLAAAWCRWASAWR